MEISNLVGGQAGVWHTTISFCSKPWAFVEWLDISEYLQEKLHQVSPE